MANRAGRGTGRRGSEASGQEAAAVFELLDEEEDVAVVEDVDELDDDEDVDDEDVDDESPEDDVEDEPLVASAFLVDSLPLDFSALTFPERESFR
ncbi:hypothetical protein Abr02nite_01720 [Paractinoplanes brasiliensis]|nr:hypothetical protein Abr02nite_01720 [Actinoplanes brasiliensis]